MARPLDWRERLASSVITPVPERPKPSLPVPPKPRPFHPNDRAGMLAYLKAVNDLPYEVDGMGHGAVIPFGFVNRGEHQEREVRGERERHLARQEALREHERRTREPWPDGEWIE